jgi:hypothetical protein
MAIIDAARSDFTGDKVTRCRHLPGWCRDCVVFDPCRAPTKEGSGQASRPIEKWPSEPDGASSEAGAKA